MKPVYRAQAARGFPLSVAPSLGLSLIPDRQSGGPRGAGGRFTQKLFLINACGNGGGNSKRVAATGGKSHPSSVRDTSRAQQSVRHQTSRGAADETRRASERTAPRHSGKSLLLSRVRYAAQVVEYLPSPPPPLHTAAGPLLFLCLWLLVADGAELQGRDGSWQVPFPRHQESFSFSNWFIWQHLR